MLGVKVPTTGKFEHHDSDVIRIEVSWFVPPGLYLSPP